jgi:hypothetical protein
MEQTLTLNDGTILKNSHAMPLGEGLYFYLGDSELTMQEALRLFTDPSNVEKIVYTSGKVSIEYDGYTEIDTIRNEKVAITGILVKPVD